MIVREFRGKSPVFSDTARGAENITVVGEVVLGNRVSLWYGCVLRGDNGAILIGDETNIQDGCIIHDGADIGRGVTVGHGAVLHGCKVEDNCLIGMGSILLNGCVIGENSVVAAGALVLKGTVIPPNSLAVGVPAKVVRTLTEEDIERNRRAARHYLEVGPEELALLKL